MYSRFIHRSNGKIDGPYRYKSIREGDTVRSIYVGKGNLMYSSAPLDFEKSLSVRKLPYGLTAPKNVPLRELAMVSVEGQIGLSNEVKEDEEDEGGPTWGAVSGAEHHGEILDRMIQEGRISRAPNKVVDSRVFTRNSFMADMANDFFKSNPNEKVIAIHEVLDEKTGQFLNWDEAYNDDTVYKRIQASAIAWREMGFPPDMKIVYDIMGTHKVIGTIQDFLPEKRKK